jgi:hypothetical protein
MAAGCDNEQEHCIMAAFLSVLDEATGRCIGFLLSQGPRVAISLAPTMVWVCHLSVTG